MPHFPISMRQMAELHPNSVWQSLIDYGDWIGKLDISTLAKRLTRLRGRHFRLAVQKIISQRGYARCIHDD